MKKAIITSTSERNQKLRAQLQKEGVLVNSYHSSKGKEINYIIEYDDEEELINFYKKLEEKFEGINLEYTDKKENRWIYFNQFVYWKKREQ